MVLAFASSAAAQESLYCAFAQIAEDEAGYKLYYVYEFERSTPQNCDIAGVALGWYPPDFTAEYEDCPYCSNDLVDVAAIQNRGLPRLFGQCESLCSFIAPKRAGAASCPASQRGLCPLASHDVQVQTATGPEVSVRLFDIKVRDCAKGGCARERIIRVGFETDRPVLATCRPFSATLVPKRDYQAEIDYHGQKYTIITKTRLVREATASSKGAEVSRTPS
ncbi:hypothetical protein AYO47_01820 [Planctomyces sp. SCGC AG-212-M04]|nr:hypothetical protein AYO47_01820 [Planctomyces sp. SCGC AG-212-M04]